MKISITAIFIFICSLAYGQSTYKTLISEASIYYKEKDYKKSVEKYKEAFKIEQNSGNDVYNAACSAALLGEKNLAFKWLNVAFKKNNWYNIKHLKKDTDLVSLHESKKWDKLLNEMQEAIDIKEADYDKPLQAKLLAIFDDDQIIRRAYVAARNEFGYQSKQADSLSKIMFYRDSINLIKVTEILDQYGWVGPDKVGEAANQTLFLVIQHADLATQQKYLPMMRAAVKNNNASSKSLALLEDRVALGEGRRQIYGSQIGYDNDTNTSFVLPLDDPDNVDKRRAEAGLGPISEYVIQWNIIWDAEEYKKTTAQNRSKTAKIA
ncbi:MAG: DUF6624 domain-containing protein [Chitinophagales bacterium]|nr:hypothetical protein [Bacteroidota bacterium]MCB9044240.1 hypothetical protein [Chitinophagales bacterium]